MFFFLMIRRPPRSTRTDTLFPYTTLFRSRKEGAWTFVALGREQRVKPALAAIDLWGADEPESPWTVADAARLAAVRADRAAAAARYFASQAERWDAIRSLHISANEVEAAIQRALAGRDLGRLVDGGTGTSDERRVGEECVST